MTELREATVEDIPEMIEMGRLMHHESPRYRNSNYDVDKVANLMTLLITGERALIVVAERRIEPEKFKLTGMLFAFVTEDYFGNDLTASDLLLFVRPEDRNGITAVRLIKEYEKWAKDCGAKQISLGVSAGVHSEKTLELCNRLGFRDGGGLAYKEV